MDYYGASRDARAEVQRMYEPVKSLDRIFIALHCIIRKLVLDCGQNNSSWNMMMHANKALKDSARSPTSPRKPRILWTLEIG